MPRTRRRLRSQVLSLNQNLANLNRQLQQSNAELARLNEQKTQFVGMAAHDLRSPLGTIAMAAQCLRMQAEDILDEDSLDFLSRIESVSESARHLVDSFLDLSVIESGRLKIERKPTDIRAVIDKARPLLEIPAKKKQVSIAVHHGSDVPESVMVDGPRLEQVVVNFLSNAVQHTNPNSTVDDFHMPGRDKSQGVGHGSGGGDTAGGDSPALQAIRARNHEENGGREKHRVGLGHRPEDRGGPRWHRLDRERTRQGIDVLLHHTNQLAFFAHVEPTMLELRTHVSGEKPKETDPQRAGCLNGWDLGLPVEGTVEVASSLGREDLDCAFCCFETGETASRNCRDIASLEME